MFCIFDVFFVVFFVVNVVDSFITVEHMAERRSINSFLKGRRIAVNVVDSFITVRHMTERRSTNSYLQGRRIAEEEAAFAKKKKVVTTVSIQPKVLISPESAALLQKSGVYDYTTLPYEDQDKIENYYGPIEIKSAGKKGRGLFVNRDVRMGELLFAEKAIAYKKENKKVGEVDYQDSAQRIESDLALLVNSDPRINAQLSYLAHDRITPNLCIPSMESFRQQTFVEVPILSAMDVKVVMELNGFGFDQRQPSNLDREKMAISLSVGVEEDIFTKGYIERQLSQVPSILPLCRYPVPHSTLSTHLITHLITYSIRRSTHLIIPQQHFPTSS